MATSFLSEEESRRYDRQVRIWGTDAQLRIQNSKVLIIGLESLAPEVIKNIVLMGVHVTLYDDKKTTLEDLNYNYFLREEDIGYLRAEKMHSRIQELNSFCKLEYNTTSFENISDDYYLNFQVIMISGRSITETLRICDLCRSSDKIISIFCSESFGHESCFLSDFGSSFKYKNDQPFDKLINTGSSPSIRQIFERKWSSMISKKQPLSSTYVKFRVLLRFRELFKRNPLLEDFMNLLSITSNLLNDNGISNKLINGDLVFDENSQFSISKDEVLCFSKVASITPITSCSVLGSFLAQEIVKAISESGKPDSNIFSFSGETFEKLMLSLFHRNRGTGAKL